MLVIYHRGPFRSNCERSCCQSRHTMYDVFGNGIPQTSGEDTAVITKTEQKQKQLNCVKSIHGNKKINLILYVLTLFNIL